MKLKLCGSFNIVSWKPSKQTKNPMYCGRFFQTIMILINTKISNLWLTYLDQSNCILNAVILCSFTTMLFISFVFITRQTVYNKLWKDHFRSAKTSLQHVLCAFCALCLTGRKAGCVGCWLLCDSVQTFGSSTHGPWSKQLQKVCSPQPVCHPQESVHQCHAGTTQRQVCVCQ